MGGQVGPTDGIIGAELAGHWGQWPLPNGHHNAADKRGPRLNQRFLRKSSPVALLFLSSPVMWASPMRSAARIALLYAILSGIYIYVSDQFALAVAGRDPDLVTQWQSFKGLAFVAGSALIIFFLVLHY